MIGRLLFQHQGREASLFASLVRCYGFVEASSPARGDVGSSARYCLGADVGAVVVSVVEQ